MSYCRFSDDDFQCDLYVYADVSGGYTTFVAGNRFVFKEPLPPPVPWDAYNTKAFFARHERVSDMVDEAERVPIGLPHDGADYNDDNAEACADRLEALRAVGYNVPQYAIDALRSEAASPTARGPSDE